MDIKDLRYFLAVANEGTVTKAAEKLCISQPPLSRELKNLEEELGTVLFNRGRRQVELTPDGEFFKQQAQEILALVESTENHLKNKGDSTVGTVNIGVTEACGAGVFSDIAARLHLIYPHISYNVWCSNSREIGERVDIGLADIGIIREPFNSSKHDAIPLRQEAWVVMLSKTHPLARKEEGDIIELSDIAPYPLIVPSRQAVNDEIHSWFNEKGIRREILCSYNTLACVTPLVEKNIGVAITTESAYRFTNNSKFVYKTIVNPQRFSNLLIIRRRNKILPPAAACFWNYVQDGKTKQSGAQPPMCAENTARQ